MRRHAKTHQIEERRIRRAVESAHHQVFNVGPSETTSRKTNAVHYEKISRTAIRSLIDVR